MKKTMSNKNGFTLVELMIAIAIIALLAALAVPAYSNYIMRTRFQDEINKMDNYRKAIAIFIQESGATSNEEFQSGLADVKDNYLGDENVAIMSEVKANNGRLLAHPVINDNTYQIALTPRINTDGTLVNWECEIRNETDGSAPPSGAMPNGCNPEKDDLNDDQVAYIDEFNDMNQVRESDYKSANDDWNERHEDARDGNALKGIAPDQEYADLIAARNEDYDEFLNYRNEESSLNSQISTKQSEINSKQSSINSLDNQAAAKESNEAYYREQAANNPDNADYWNGLADTAQSDAATLRSQITTLENDKTTLENDKSALELTKATATTNKNNAFNDYETNNKAASDRNIEIRNNVKDLPVPDDLQVPEGSTLAKEIAKYSYTNSITQANQDYNSSLNNINTSDDFTTTTDLQFENGYSINDNSIATEQPIHESP